MPFDPILAAIRFGSGLSPTYMAPADINVLLDDLRGPDAEAAAFPVPPFRTARPSLLDLNTTGRARNAAKGTPDEADAQATHQALRDRAEAMRTRNLRVELARRVTALVGFRERLIAFWADHFTVLARGNNMRHLVTPYIEEAIRPHVAGRFADMLQAVATHPMMLLYLQQTHSVGPNSLIGQRQGKGLNENLARELLELHSLGTDGPYGQDDVRQLAELLAGLTYRMDRGFVYDARVAEPGAETLLGVTYGADATLANVRAALGDLAVHPATAAHLARKLAVHFVDDTPDADLVAQIENAFVTTGGDLLAVGTALVTAPKAWTPTRAKVRNPMDYITASLRALGVPGGDIMALSDRDLRRHITGPLRIMGQPWQRPTGPDGWPEAPGDWIIPQTMAGRITWAMTAPQTLRDPLPDPRSFVRVALGPSAPADVVFAAGAAETLADGIGVVLASAAFQRR